MTWEEAEAFIESVPWRAVKPIKYAEDGMTRDPNGRAPDPHEYVIMDWQEVDQSHFAALVNLIRAEGYKGRYSPPYDPDRVMTNDYLEVGEHIYWFIYPRMLNRQLAVDRQHEIITEGQH